MNNNKEKTLCTDDNTSDRHPTNGINILLVFASCIWLVIIGVCIMQRDKITVDSILHFTPENPFLAVIVLLLLFALKSISIILYSGVLYIAAGVLFPLPIAIIVNLCGTAVMVTIPYFIGKKAGTPLVNQILQKHPKAALLKKIRTGNDFIFCFLSRIINVLPCDLVSMYMGAIQIKYGSYLLGCLLGMLPPMITFPVMGMSITDIHSPQFIVALCIELSFMIVSATVCTIYWKAHKTYTK